MTGRKWSFWSCRMRPTLNEPFTLSHQPPLPIVRPTAASPSGQQVVEGEAVRRGYYYWDQPCAVFAFSHICVARQGSWKNIDLVRLRCHAAVRLLQRGLPFASFSGQPSRPNGFALREDCLCLIFAHVRNLVCPWPWHGLYCMSLICFR